MAVKVLAKRGTAAQIEAAVASVQSAGEIAFATDTKDFYVSDGTQFNKIGTSDLEAFEEITIGLDLDTWHVNPDNFIDITTDSSPTEVTFKPDGTRVFVLGSTTRTVLQYDLGTAWDLTTAGSVTQSSSLTTLSGGLLGGSLEGLYIDSTGTRLYALSRGSDSISQYTIDTAWDISSLTFVQDIHVNSTGDGGFVIGDNNPRAMTFKPDGTVIYIAGYDSDEVHQVPLSTAWDISSHGTITSISYDPPANVVSGIQFSSDGTTLFTIDDTGESIEQWTLSTAWDITTLTLAGVSLPIISMYETTPQGLYYSDTLAKAFVVGSTRDFVWEIVVEETVKFSKPIHSDAVYGRTVNAHQINVHLEDDSINGIRVARNNHVQYANLGYAILEFGNGSGQIRGNSLAFYQTQTLSNGDAFKFLPNSGRRLTDTNAEQSFMLLSPDIGQSGTANYVGLLMDVTETSVGSGTNSLMDLRVGGTSKFSVRNDGSSTFSDGSTNNFIIKKNPNGNIYIGSSDNTRFGFAAGQVNLGFATGGDNNNVPLALGTFSNAQPLILGTDNKERVRIDGPTGNVGIGTTSPAAKLHVATSTSGGAASTIIQDDVRTGAGTLNYIGLTDSAGTTQAKIGYLSTLNGDLSFSNLIGSTTVSSTGQVTLDASSNIILNTNGSTSVKIDNTGKVGIGTTSPAQKLDVNGYIASSRLVGRSTTGLIAGSHVASSYALGVQYNSNQSATSGDKSILNAFGNWNPSSGLANFNGITVSPTLNQTGTALGGARGFYYNPTVTSVLGTHRAIETTAGDVIFNGGNVGIGTTAPSATLHVQGTIQQTVDAAANQYPIQLYNDHAGTDYYLLRQRVVNTGNQVRTGLGITGAPDAAFVLGPQTDQIIKFWDVGSIVNVATISATSTMKINATEIRTGDTTQSAAAHFNIVSTNSSTKPVLGLKQGVGASNLMISIGDSSGTPTMGITSEGGFYFRDSNLIGRYTFDHDYLPSTVDGLTTGFEFRTENASGVLTTFGYIDVTNDDRTLQESSMRLSVGQSTPAEIMRLQSDGNVGIGTTLPAHKLDVSDSNSTIAVFRTTNANADLYLRASGTGSDGKVGIRASANNLRLISNGATQASFNGSNFGIGTSSASGILHTYSTSAPIFESPSNASIIIRRNDNVGYRAILQYHSGNSVKWVAGLSDTGDFTGSTGNDYFIGRTNNDPKLLINADGSVGIGQVTPTSTLHVNGTALRQFRLEAKGGPTDPNDTNGREGDFAYDDDFLYIKTANGWGRTQLDFAW